MALGRIAHTAAGTELRYSRRIFASVAGKGRAVEGRLDEPVKVPGGFAFFDSVVLFSLFWEKWSPARLLWFIDGRSNIASLRDRKEAFLGRIEKSFSLLSKTTVFGKPLVVSFSRKKTKFAFELSGEAFRLKGAFDDSIRACDFRIGKAKPGLAQNLMSLWVQAGARCGFRKLELNLEGETLMDAFKYGSHPWKSKKKMGEIVDAAKGKGLRIRVWKGGKTADCSPRYSLDTMAGGKAEREGRRGAWTHGSWFPPSEKKLARTDCSYRKCTVETGLRVLAQGSHVVERDGRNVDCSVSVVFREGERGGIERIGSRLAVELRGGYGSLTLDGEEAAEIGIDNAASLYFESRMKKGAGKADGKTHRTFEGLSPLERKEAVDCVVEALVSHGCHAWDASPSAKRDCKKTVGREMRRRFGKTLSQGDCASLSAWVLDREFETYRRLESSVSSRGYEDWKATIAFRAIREMAGRRLPSVTDGRTIVVKRKDAEEAMVALAESYGRLVGDRRKALLYARDGKGKTVYRTGRKGLRIAR